jgi:hypothetical protein
MAARYRLKKRLAEDTSYYDRDAIEKYVDYLDERGRLLRLANLFFDTEALRRPFVCDTRLCFDAKGNGQGRRKSCCVVYAPRLSTRERERVDTILEGLQARFPHVRRAVARAGSYYEWDESYDRLVRKVAGNRCIFLTPDTSELGFHGCTIHAFCLEKGLAPALYKPSACVMFPLFLLDLNDDAEHILVTSHCHEVMTLGEEDDNFADVGCGKPNKLAKRPLYIEMKDTLVEMFGADLWKRLDQALRQEAKSKD